MFSFLCQRIARKPFLSCFVACDRFVRDGELSELIVIDNCARCPVILGLKAGRVCLLTFCWKCASRQPGRMRAHNSSLRIPDDWTLAGCAQLSADSSDRVTQLFQEYFD